MRAGRDAVSVEIHSELLFKYFENALVLGNLSQFVFNLLEVTVSVPCDEHDMIQCDVHLLRAWR